MKIKALLAIACLAIAGTTAKADLGRSYDQCVKAWGPAWPNGGADTVGYSMRSYIFRSGGLEITVMLFNGRVVNEMRLPIMPKFNPND